MTSHWWEPNAQVNDPKILCLFLVRDRVLILFGRFNVRVPIMEFMENNCYRLRLASLQSVDVKHGVRKVLIILPGTCIDNCGILGKHVNHSWIIGSSDCSKKVPMSSRWGCGWEAYCSLCRTYSRSFDSGLDFLFHRGKSRISSTRIAHWSYTVLALSRISSEWFPTPSTIFLISSIIQKSFHTLRLSKFNEKWK